jgi:branched-chain amino acid aminotransferase
MSLIWFEGRLRPAAEVAISPSDRGFTLGDGLFETLCWRGGRILALEAHLARLLEGARVLEIPLPLLPEALAAALAATATGNGLSEAALRLTLSRGPGARGLAPPPDPRPTLLISAAPLPAPLPPARLITATFTRRNQHSPLARIKSLNYLDNILARQEAARAGADDALLLNTEGRLAEASASSLFALIGGELLTPPVADGALPGVRRAAWLAAGQAREQPLTPALLLRAEALVLTNSLGVRAVAALDGRDYRPLAVPESLSG